MKNAFNRFNAGVELFFTGHERILLWGLCTLALVRIFFFSAVFPFFNNVDETSHFDTVVKYSNGYLPREGTMNFTRESAQIIMTCRSPEYLNSPEAYAFGKFPPPCWSLDRKQDLAIINRQVLGLTRTANHEAFSPPVYYALAGGWYNFGKLVGFKDAHLLYWIRFLNLPVYAFLFWCTFLFCKTAVKTSPVMRFCVLLLLAFFPQDVFYSINSDILSPLFCVIALYLLIRIYEAEETSPLLHVLAGTAVSAALLTKLSNLPLLGITAILIFLRIRKVQHDHRLKKELPRLALLTSAGFLPLILWLGWNSYALGDITGNAEKIRHLGWTANPLAEILNHPVLNLEGFIYFTNELLKTFWRGEFVWILERIASQKIDVFYILSSYTFVLCSVIHALVSKSPDNPQRRFTVGISALTLLFFGLFLAVLSTLYDFGNCWYPSRDYPFFTSGRLILGSLIPFLILYLDGLRLIVSKVIGGQITLLLSVILICVFMTYSEIRITWPVLGSPYNWFHLF